MSAAAVRVLIPQQLEELPLLPATAAIVRTLAGATMGTGWTVKFVAEPAWPACTVDVESAVQAALDSVVAQMSTWLPSSELSRFNDAQSGSLHVLSEGFATVLDVALRLARDSDGAYDPTAGALVDLWGFGPAPRRETVPAVTEIEAARRRGGWRKLHFDATRRWLRQPGLLRLDLSSIAKGYGVDLVCATLHALGIANFLVEVGGELRGQGCKPDGTPWWVDLERTDDEADFAPLRIALHGLAVATSGDARRYFRANDQRYSHTLDPRTGWPIRESTANVTVLHRECMHADALATAIAVLGPQDGLAFAEQRNIAARIVSRTDVGAQERMTSAFMAMAE